MTVTRVLLISCDHEAGCPAFIDVDGHTLRSALPRLRREGWQVTASLPHRAYCSKHHVPRGRSRSHREHETP